LTHCETVSFRYKCAVDRLTIIAAAVALALIILGIVALREGWVPF